MVRAEPTNTCTTGVDTYHSSMFMSLLEINVICGQRCIQFEWQNSLSRACVIDGKIPLPFSKSVKSDHNWNFWYVQNNHIETKYIFSVRSSLIRQSSKILKSESVLIRSKLASVLIQTDPFLIRAHLCQLHVAWDVVSLEVRIPSGREHYSLSTKIRQVDFW